MKYSYCYDDNAKKRVASQYRSALRKVAHAFGLTKDQYDLRFNPGGIAVWGEVTLHTGTLYIQASAGYDGLVLVRQCAGQRDYTGGRNHYLPTLLLIKRPDLFAIAAKQVETGDTRAIASAELTSGKIWDKV